MARKPHKDEESSSSDTLCGRAPKGAWGREIRWRGALFGYPLRNADLLLQTRERG
ncbi:MAG TPA: hypothetical protein VG965_04635 [Patescibacteria group bacterium]|nr:hypothetical protein [Patescibacteria group bacterium]